MARLKPPIDVFYEERDSGTFAVVEVELAGVEPDDVELDVEGRTLELRGLRQPPAAAGRVYQQTGIARGQFSSRVELGADVDADAARAGYRDGILRVEMPLRSS